MLGEDHARIKMSVSLKGYLKLMGDGWLACKYGGIDKLEPRRFSGQSPRFCRRSLSFAIYRGIMTQKLSLRNWAMQAL
jgi:hypothetical protein